MQGAFAPAAPAIVFPMDEAELFLWRIDRLQAAVDHLDGGNKNAFGRRMGWSDGTYVRQMLAGKRPITEKLIRSIQAIPGMEGWFEEAAADDVPDLALQVRKELLFRDVPDHVLQTFLEMLKALPPKRNAA